MARKAIRPQLINYLREHPGVNVFCADLCEALGETQQRRVMSGMSNLLRSPDRDQFTREFAEDVIKISMGVWRYQPKGVKVAGTAQKLFTEIGAAKDGSLVLECEDGTLYRAVEL